MYFRIAACTAILLLAGASSNVAMAGHVGGASASSPGALMQANPSAHDASAFSPGHVMQGALVPGTPPGKSTEPGASGFAPGDTLSHGKK